MRQRIFAFVLGLGICAVCAYPLQAQTTSSANLIPDKQFYVFASPGSASRLSKDAFSLPIGAGAERLLFQHIVVGAEFAESLVHSKFANPARPSSPNNPAYVFWGSLHGAYNFRRKDSTHQVRPFIVGGCGISGINGAGVGTQVNYGAGFNHWHTPHFGVRVEVRRFLHSGDSEGRFTGVRIGLAIR